MRIVPGPQGTGWRELRRLARQRVQVSALLHNRYIWRQRQQRLNLAMEAGPAVPRYDAHSCHRYQIGIEADFFGAFAQRHSTGELS